MMKTAYLILQYIILIPKICVNILDADFKD
jgi:hypothetical protein